MAEDDPDLKADLKAWREWNEKPVPLSAIRALVQQWREKADRLHGKAEAADDEVEAVPILTEALTWHMAGEQLAALCPAPPKDQP